MSPLTQAACFLFAVVVVSVVVTDLVAALAADAPAVTPETERSAKSAHKE